MVSFFRKLKTDATAAPLHYAIIAAAISVALLIALQRLL
jgi:Flp pilus assembly pilin Flp